jgi:site-specific recombinase XerD
MADELAVVGGETIFGQAVVVAEDMVRIDEMDKMRMWSQAYDAWMESRAAENTRQAYAKAWEDFMVVVQKAPWMVGKIDVAAWVDNMKKRALSPATIGQRMAAVSSFYSYVMYKFTIATPSGQEMGLHTFNPVKAVDRPQETQYEKATYLAPDEVRGLLNAITRDTVGGLRDYALFLAYVATGRRNSEIRNLKWGDFSQEGGRVYYRWSGKRKKRKDEMPLRCWNAICEYLKAAGRLDEMEEGSYIFTALSDKATRLGNVDGAEYDRYAQPLSLREVGRLLKKYCRRAGLDPKKVHVHTLRHTAAHLRRLAGDDVEAVSSFLAHSSISITQIYLHTMEGRKDTSWSKVEALIGL